MRIVLIFLGVSLGIVAIVLFILREQILASIGDFLMIQSEIKKAGIVHVISGADYRADYGINLVKEGYAPLIFFTGGWCDEIQGYHGARGKARAISQGVSPSAIVVDDTKVTSTYDEALRLKAFLDSQPDPITSIMIVSDLFHMRRVDWTYRKIFGPEVQIILAPVPIEKTPYYRKWWEDTDSRQNIKEEYLKLAYSLLRYQFTSGPLKSWLASLDTK
jgi:uncharacterized SAM-binding protein YcdF (DUF218 family)